MSLWLSLGQTRLIKTIQTFRFLLRAMPTESAREVSNDADNRSCFWRYITAISRTWALLTLIALWALTVQAFREKEKDVYTHWYLVAISPVITFLEVLWIFNKCACCAYDEGCCCRFWHALLWIDGWKKTILYTVFSIPCFLKGIVAKWAVIYGVVLLVLALIYFLKSIDSCCTKKPKKTETRPPDDPKSSLVQQEVQPGLSSTSYSSTGTTPPPSQGAPVAAQGQATTQTQVREKTYAQAKSDWPPAGYEVGPDGTLHAVSNEPEEIKPKKRDVNYKVETETRSEWPPPGYEVGKDGTLQEVKKPGHELKKPRQDPQESFEPENAPWPPPGFEIGRDGTLQRSNPGQTRPNPFNKGNA